MHNFLSKLPSTVYESSKLAEIISFLEITLLRNKNYFVSAEHSLDPLSLHFFTEF